MYKSTIDYRRKIAAQVAVHSRVHSPTFRGTGGALCWFCTTKSRSSCSVRRSAKVANKRLNNIRAVYIGKVAATCAVG